MNTDELAPLGLALAFGAILTYAIYVSIRLNWEKSRPDSYDLHTDLIEARRDRDRAHQVISFLLANASPLEIPAEDPLESPIFDQLVKEVDHNRRHPKRPMAKPRSKGKTPARPRPKPTLNLNPS